MNIPFNKPTIVGNELKYIENAFSNYKISGDGYFTKMCSTFMQERFNAKKVLLTTSCTHALELASILIDIKQGDEVIVPPYTFVSTVNSFILRGGIPVFVDIRPDTLNIDEMKIEARITKRTKAIFVVHYAGVACEMDKIMQIARDYNLYVIEDAAQGVNAKYHDKYLGTIGDLGAYSFHETKNYYCGEGGALVINNPSFIERAEIIREKGTDRSKFFRGEVDKYTWVDLGSSYLPSDILAAFLYGQLEKLEEINNTRKDIFDFYYENLYPLEEAKLIRRPVIPDGCSCNYHMFYLILPDEEWRNELIFKLKEKNIMSVFHYIPLHLSPMGLRYGYKSGDLPFTETLSARLLRLPMYSALKMEEQEYIIKNLYNILNNLISEYREG